eukprot:SAG22_NODE_1128_length_5460_cov_15.018280_2_plen_119_part_00
MNCRAARESCCERKTVKKDNKSNYHALEVSKLCATLKVGDKVEIMFNNAKNKDAKHTPKWFPGTVVDLEGKAQRVHTGLLRGLGVDSVGAGGDIAVAPLPVILACKKVPGRTDGRTKT